MTDRAANDFGIHSKILAQSGGIMDIALGPKRVSWRAFVGSAVLSVAAAVVLYLLFLAFGQVDGPYWDKFKSRGSRGLLIVGFSVLVYNLVPDYLSLIESRWTLSRMIAAQRAIPLFLWLVFDIAASAAIWVCPVFVDRELSGFDGISC